jgi:hypothetical protein
LVHEVMRVVVLAVLLSAAAGQKCCLLQVFHQGSSCTGSSLFQWIPINNGGSPCMNFGSSWSYVGVTSSDFTGRPYLQAVASPYAESCSGQWDDSQCYSSVTFKACADSYCSSNCVDVTGGTWHSNYLCHGFPQSGITASKLHCGAETIKDYECNIVNGDDDGHKTCATTCADVHDESSCETYCDYQLGDNQFYSWSTFNEGYSCTCTLPFPQNGCPPPCSGTFTSAPTPAPPPTPAPATCGGSCVYASDCGSSCPHCHHKQTLSDPGTCYGGGTPPAPNPAQGTTAGFALSVKLWASSETCSGNPE